MQKSLLILLLLSASAGHAQADTAGLTIPMRNGIIFYEKLYPVSGTREAIVRQLRQWFRQSAVTEKTSAGNKNSDSIYGQKLFRVKTDESGHFFWLRALVVALVHDNGYTLRVYNYYDKPTVKGVTNDYSKIEYRWRDFRKGKPWTPEDRMLFSGLNDKTLLLMASAPHSK